MEIDTTKQNALVGETLHTILQLFGKELGPKSTNSTSSLVREISFYFLEKRTKQEEYLT